jgi:PAS domain-containing protein
VVAHNTDADPQFIYANETAQAQFEYSWDEFIQLKSRFSAEEPNRFERQRLLESVAQKGFVTGYRGLRISRSGRRFWIQDGVVWQLMNEIGITLGQAAVFRSWRDA